MKDLQSVGFDLSEFASSGLSDVWGDENLTGQQEFKRFRRKTSPREDGGISQGREVIPNLPVRLDAWAQLPRIPTWFSDPGRSDAPLVNLHRDGAASRAFDLLRTRLLQALRDNGWSRVAIAAPTRGCGATFTAVNLALSLARIPGSRTVLTDLDMRAPGVAATLGLDAPGRMREFLSGDAPVNQQYLRISDTLAVGLTAQVEKDASERLQSPEAERSLRGMIADLGPAVALFDLPPVLEHDDLAAFLPQVDGVLLVADGQSTTSAHIAACERVLNGQTRLLGVVLNRARGSGKYLGDI